MENNHTIIVDTLGSDKGPLEIIEGAKLLLENFSDLHIVLVGDEELIKQSNISLERVKIIDSKGTISNYDNPVEAFYKNKDVSIFKAFQEASENENAIGIISSGNSGALIVSTIKYLLKDRTIRPCMAAILPTTTNAFTCLVDTGATIDCVPSQLISFAHLGSEFMKLVYKIDRPRVGLLSNGAEETKGNKLVKETHKLLKEDTEINFVGNIEGNKTLSGLCDVLVCDGFAGNQVLKNSEGMAINLITEIVKFSKKNNDPNAMAIVKYLMQTYDFESLGAGIILGAKLPIMKCRGSSGRNAILNAGRIIYNIANNKTIYEGQDKRRE